MITKVGGTSCREGMGVAGWQLVDKKKTNSEKILEPENKYKN